MAVRKKTASSSPATASNSSPSASASASASVPDSGEQQEKKPTPARSRSRSKKGISNSSSPAAEKKRSGPKDKFDYSSPEFYNTIQELAAAGYSDASIAYNLAETFGLSLAPETFSRFKNERDDKGEPTERCKRINQALARGRTNIMQAARSTYYQMALGQRRVKTVRKSAVSKRCPCCYDNDMVPKEDCQRCGGTGWYNLTDKVITEDTEMELAPNMQALATFLYNNDPEWRENVLKMKREEAEAAAAAGGAGDGLPTAVNIRITYNQKEDLALQEKFKKPSQ